MSHWMQAKVKDLHCSLEKMREAIVNIMPEWASQVQTSPNGDMTVYSSHNHDSKSGYHIRIPENGSDIRYCDLGFKKLSDGSWYIEYDRGGLPLKMQNIPDALKNEISAMTMKERAEIENLNMIEDSRGKERRQVIRMTPAEAEKFLETL